jgi:hypothetical protein
MSSVYFCEHCGSVLPEDVRLDARNHRNVKKIKSKKKKDKNFETLKNLLNEFSSSISMRSVVLGVILGIFISIQFYLFFKTELWSGISRTVKGAFPNQEISSQTPNAVSQKNPIVEEKKYDMETELEIISGPFGQYNVTKYVPYEASFYLEFNDVQTLGSYFGFLGGEFFTLVENIRDDIEPFYAAFEMKKGVKNGWVVLVFPNKESLNLGNYDEILVDTVDDALVISSEPILIDEVKLAKSEVTKNLSMHPSLISMKPFLPDSGKIFLFKVRKDGDGAVEDLRRITTSEDFKFIIEEYINSREPFLVIK